VTTDFGFVSNYDPRYYSGWRRVLCVLGLTEWRWVRGLLGGLWECWYVAPCGQFIWHPVEGPPAPGRSPCPVWYPYYLCEDHRESSMVAVGFRVVEMEGEE
jgi:hypothetical protein